jgi:hypothetical protein
VTIGPLVQFFLPRLTVDLAPAERSLGRMEPSTVP